MGKGVGAELIATQTTTPHCILCLVCLAALLGLCAQTERCIGFDSVVLNPEPPITDLRAVSDCALEWQPWGGWGLGLGWPAPHRTRRCLSQGQSLRRRLH